MPTRRTILQSAAALSAAPLAPKVVFAGGSRSAAHLGAVYDNRHAPARAFSRCAAKWEAPVHGTVDGDITDLWQNVLAGAWKSNRLAVAGLTERPALFLLEQLGWQHGMRVFFQAGHEPVGEGRWVHRVVRSSTRALEGQLEAAGASWPAVLADQLLTAPREVASKDITPTGAAMAARLHEPEKLWSWIIAPKSAVELI